MTPITLVKDYRERGQRTSNATNVVPCGKCILCLRRRQNAWAFRLQQEELNSLSSCFITLTYETAPLSFNGHHTLLKKDYQNFVKRLRKRLQSSGMSSKIKYYACGEYGTLTLRPHYHAVMFNLPRNYIERPENLLSAWQHGHVEIAPLNEGRIRYVTKYVMKGRYEPLTDCDDRLPEFSLMSKNMGLNYLTKSMYNHHKTKLISHVTLQGGVITALPRYFRDKIFTKSERLIINQSAEEARQACFEELFNSDSYAELIWKKDLIRKNEKSKLLERAKI